MNAFWLSTVVIVLAELGDKSQLMAMTFAARYSAKLVLLAISGATLLVHLASVGLGQVVGQGLTAHQWLISVLAGAAFLVFAAWTLRGDRLTDAEAHRADHVRGAAVLAIGAAFALAELGDKTMLATVTLATKEDWLGTWLGSTVGMVAADALAIAAGMLLGRALPERVLKIGAAVAFVIFGVLLIVEGLQARP